MNTSRSSHVDYQASSSGVVFDTGPLLCFGHAAGGVRLVRGRYYGRSKWVKAVANEISKHARSTNPVIKNAALQWMGRNGSWLGVPHEVVDRNLVETMRTLVQAEGTRPVNPVGDLGESESLVLAQRDGLMILANENAARRVARRLGLSAHCTFDVLVAAYREGTLEFNRLLRMNEQLREAGLDHGGDIRMPLRERAVREWKTPAPF